jgi:hypothetical protein
MARFFRVRADQNAADTGSASLQAALEQLVQRLSPGDGAKGGASEPSAVDVPARAPAPSAQRARRKAAATKHDPDKPKGPRKKKGSARKR